MQVVRASVWLVARLVLPEQRCGVGWTRGPPPLPPAAVGGGLEGRPLVRTGGCCPLRRALQCGERGGALTGLYLSFLWESFVLFLVFSMVFSLA